MPSSSEAPTSSSRCLGPLKIKMLPLSAMPGSSVPWQYEETCHEAAKTCLYGGQASCSRYTQGFPLVSLPSGGSGFDQSACAQWSHR